MCIFFCKEFYFEISGLNAEYYGQHFQKFHSPILIFSNSLLDTPALAINHHIALLLSNLEICQLAIATLSIVAVAPFFPFGHLNYIGASLKRVACARQIMGSFKGGWFQCRKFGSKGSLALSRFPV